MAATVGGPKGPSSPLWTCHGSSDSREVSKTETSKGQPGWPTTASTVRQALVDTAWNGPRRTWPCIMRLLWPMLKQSPGAVTSISAPSAPSKLLCRVPYLHETPPPDQESVPEAATPGTPDAGSWKVAFKEQKQHQTSHLHYAM